MLMKGQKINDRYQIIRSIGEGDDNKTHIQGYALNFNKMSEDLGFREIISRGALDDCDMSNVVLNINHSMDKPLARNRVTEPTIK